MKFLLGIMILGIFSSVKTIAQDEDVAIVKYILDDGTEPLWVLKNIKSDIDHPNVRDRIRILANKKNSAVLCEYVPFDTSFFTGAKIIRLSKYPRPLLITNWIRGARSPCLRVFDPTLGKTALLTEYCSIDLKYDVKSDHIDISEFRYKDRNDSTLIELRTEWRPTEEPKAAPSDNPPAPQDQ